MNLARETEVLGGNLPWRHFVLHEIPHDDAVSNPGPQRWEVSDQPLELWRGLSVQPLISLYTDCLIVTHTSDR
jgi:hypothetical protein